MARLNVNIVLQGYIRQLCVQPTLEEKIRKAQETDENLMKIRKHTGENKAPDFKVDDQGTLWYRNRICVPENGDFRQTIMNEAHNSAYSIHPGSTKMYMDLKRTLPRSSLTVILVRGLKLNTRNPQDCCSLYPSR
jgi:hypothetical protein